MYAPDIGADLTWGNFLTFESLNEQVTKTSPCTRPFVSPLKKQGCYCDTTLVLFLF